MKFLKLIMLGLMLLHTSTSYGAFINFNSYNPVGYGGQDSTGNAVSSIDGSSFFMDGNLWVSVLQNITVDNTTTIYFDFIASGGQAELYGIGLDNDGVNNNFDQLFIFGGTQVGTPQFPTGANVVGDYKVGDGATKISIDIGAFLQGLSFSRLIFMLDNDENENVSAATFANFEICSEGEVCQSLTQVSEPPLLGLLALLTFLWIRRHSK